MSSNTIIDTLPHIPESRLTYQCEGIDSYSDCNSDEYYEPHDLRWFDQSWICRSCYQVIELNSDKYHWINIPDWDKLTTLDKIIDIRKVLKEARDAQS